MDSDEDTESDEDDEDLGGGHSLDCVCETCIQNHPEREFYVDAEEDK